MNLIYHKDWRGNFGDDLNIPFFKTLFPDYESVLIDKSLYGIGTLLNNVHGKIKNANIFGSGFGYGDKVDVEWSTTKVFGVRGPLTALALGIDSDKYVIGDPAMYVGKMPNFLTGGNLYNQKKVIALHHRTSELWDFEKNNNTDYLFLDPGIVDIPSYISAIRGADIVYAESLHGAIIASAFGIPFIPISIRGILDERKWEDFYSLIHGGTVDAISINSPQIPILRRIATSKKMRSMKKPQKLGVSIESKDIEVLTKEIEVMSSNRKPVITPTKIIKDIQIKIDLAIENFNDYLNKSR